LVSEGTPTGATVKHWLVTDEARFASAEILALALVNAAGNETHDELVWPTTLVTAATVTEHVAVPASIASAATLIVCGKVSVAVPVQPAPVMVAADVGCKRRLAGSVSTKPIPACAGFPAPLVTVKTILVAPPSAIVATENALDSVGVPGPAPTVKSTVLLTDANGNAASTCELLATLVMAVPTGVGSASAGLTKEPATATDKARMPDKIACKHHEADLGFA